MRSVERFLAGCAVLLFFPAVQFAAPEAPNRPVSFTRDIAPIIRQNCASCHRPGESAPFSLLTYEDVKRHSVQIAAVTKSRYMPPWLPEPGHGEFREERRLTDAQISSIQDWVKQGGPAGSAVEISKDSAVAGNSAQWQLGRPDLVLNVPEPYHLAAAGQEVFWNFIIPVPVTTTRWVRAVEIRPGNPRVIHHASIILDRSRSARRQPNVQKAGFPGMDLTIEETTFDPDGTFLAWKPGNVPAAEPEGMAWRADPGMDLIFNVHLRPSGKPENVAPVIGLYFTDKPPNKFPMLLELENDSSIDIQPGDRDYVVKDDFRTPLDLQVLAIYPHAHYRAKLIEGYATLPDGTRKWLIRIPAWDLNWQGVYHYKDPVHLPAGSIISMRFHYDNSAENPRNPSRPPVRVKGGGRAEDEMGNLWMQVLPVGDGDQRPVLEEALMRQRLEKHPDDFASHFNLGDALLAKGDVSGAIPHFERAQKAKPGSAIAATELGVALSAAQRYAEAIQQFRRALEIDPGFVDARFDLALAEAEYGDLESAWSDFKQVLAARPEDAKAKQHLGELLFMRADRLSQAGKFQEACATYKEALLYRVGDPELHTSLAVALARSGQLAEARQQLRQALKIDAGFAPAKQVLAALEKATSH